MERSLCNSQWNWPWRRQRNEQLMKWMPIETIKCILYIICLFVVYRIYVAWNCVISTNGISHCCFIDGCFLVSFCSSLTFFFCSVYRGWHLCVPFLSKKSMDGLIFHLNCYTWMTHLSLFLLWWCFYISPFYIHHCFYIFRLYRFGTNLCAEWSVTWDLFYFAAKFKYKLK